jgi:hypothetical protein
MNNLVAGVDLSGSKNAPNEAWLAAGRLANDTFEIIELHKTTTHALSGEMQKLGHLAAVGMNFPFSFPASFIQFCGKRLEGKNFETWQDVVQFIAFLPEKDFRDHLKAFKNEAKRTTDELYKGLVLSPLHEGYPSMLQNTLTGMRMLATLDPKLFTVVPFFDPSEGTCSVLEVVPRATLWCAGVSDHAYKSVELKDQPQVQPARTAVLNEVMNLRENHPLSCKDYPKLGVAKNFQTTAVNTDNALDAIMSAYTMSIWLSKPELFPDPFDSDDENVLLEGWIFAPRKTKVK